MFAGGYTARIKRYPVCQRSGRRCVEAGFTLIELVVVVVLIALIGSLAISRLDNVMLWKQRAEIREFGAVWEVLYGEAARRGKRYRLMLNLDEGSYVVRQENPALNDQVKNVDYLANLRLDSQKQERAKAAESDVASVEDQLKEDDYLASMGLETQYYMTLGADAGLASLSVPVDLPSLGTPHKFANDLKVRDIVTTHGRKESGTAVIRFSPRGGSEFAVIHFVLGDSIITMLLNPASGQLQTIPGDVNFDWLTTGGRSK